MTEEVLKTMFKKEVGKTRGFKNTWDKIGFLERKVANISNLQLESNKYNHPLFTFNHVIEINSKIKRYKRVLTSKISFDDNYYTITLCRSELLDLCEYLNEYYGDTSITSRNIYTIFKYFLSESVGMEYYSFLDLFSTKFKEDNTIYELVKAIFEENIILKIDLISDYYDLKNVIKGGRK